MANDQDIDLAFNRMMDESGGLLPEGTAEMVEQDMTGGGNLAISRRVALALLETPFRETVARVRADHDLAVAFAVASEDLESHIEMYERLVEWLKIARTRMAAALTIREDMPAIIEEAQADAPPTEH